MFKLEVGKVIEKLKGMPEEIKFDIADDGATLLILFKNPTKKEIEEIKAGELKFGMFIKENIIFILSKFGSMPWMDAPYHVKLSKNLTRLENIKDGEGYSCTIILTDTATGEIKALRFISFGTEYSRRLKKNVETQQNEGSDLIRYNKKLDGIMFNYSTKDMVLYSEVNCKIK